MKLMNTTYRIAQSTKTSEETSSQAKSVPESKSAALKDQFTKVSGGGVMKMRRMIQGGSSGAGRGGSGADLVSAQPIDLPRIAHTADSNNGLKGSGGDQVSAQPIDLPRVAQSANSVNGVKGTGDDEISAQPINLPRTADDRGVLSGGEFVATLPLPIPQPIEDEAQEVEEDYRDLEAMRLNATIGEKRSRVEVLSNISKQNQDSKSSVIRNFRS